MRRLNSYAKVWVAAATQPLAMFPEVVGNAVAVSDDLAHRLVSAIVFRLTSTFGGNNLLSRQLPERDEASLIPLDARGIVRLGTVVRRGDILVGSVSPSAQKPDTAEERLEAIFGRRQGMHDVSLTWEAHDSGLVCDVTLVARLQGACANCGNVPLVSSAKPWSCPFCQSVLPAVHHNKLPSGELMRVTVEVVVRRELRVGDVLQDNHGHTAVVARIVPSLEMPRYGYRRIAVLAGPDVLIARALRGKGGKLRFHGQPQVSARGSELRLEKMTERLENKLAARGQGKYSLVAELPVDDDETSPAPRIQPEIVVALAKAGYIENLRELVTVKADAVAGRSSAFEALVRDRAAGPPVTDVTVTFREVSEVKERGIRELSALLNRQSIEPQPSEPAPAGTDAEAPRTREQPAPPLAPVVEPSFLPETTHRLVATLQALGIQSALLVEGSGEIELNEEAIGKPATALALRLARASDIIGWSFGPVRSQEMYHAYTLRPIQHGLYCERIFGTERNWECLCGKYKGIHYRGTQCERCGMTVQHSHVRRRRFGHVVLAAPVVHPWFLPLIAKRLDLPETDLEPVVQCQQFIVVEIDTEAFATRRDELTRLAGDQANCIPATMVTGQIIGWAEGSVLQQVGSMIATPPFTVGTGAKAVRQLLLATNISPDGLILTHLPVLPPSLRPMMQLENGQWAISDLTCLYQRCIEKNLRVGKFADINAPWVILENEQRLLQTLVEQVLDNRSTSHPFVGQHIRPLESLADTLNRIIHDLSNKRVDYAVRGVVVPDPTLVPGTLGMPEGSARELLLPLVIRQLKAAGAVETIKAGKRLIAGDPNGQQVSEAVRTAVQDRPLLLVTDEQAIGVFQPVVVEGEALRLHPDNAAHLRLTFGGELVTLHLPISPAAVDELGNPPTGGDDSSSLMSITVEQLRQAALTGTPIHLTALDRLLMGI